ncbi:MAG TPA: preprotein translocase subunit SecA [Actinomycetota bacterium]|nr:preprotein translocase subunit SecA [Actinomycetota bacterium]
MPILDKLSNLGEGRKLKHLQDVARLVNTFEPEVEDLEDRALRAKTAEFRQRHANGESLDDLLPEAFAVTREGARRTIGQRHFDVQLMGGAALHDGNIAEMKTGEGKTLVSTLPGYLNAVTGRGVHIVTVNDYLAKRDSEWMGGIYRFLGLDVGLIQSSMTPEQRRPAYAADITYGTNNEFGFDYLRDNMAMRIEHCVQRDHWFAIVDEVDSILIDEARTPLIISGMVSDSAKWYQTFARVAPRLVRDEDYEVEESKYQVAVTERGVAKVEEILDLDNLYDNVNSMLVHHLHNALRAKELYKRDVAYVVTDGEVKIVDEFTGRVLEGRRYSEGLHQAIEAKEGVKIKEENQTLATITIQNYFKMYEKLAGMTGTAKTQLTEFEETYKIGVVEIPTNRPNVRDDRQDLVYRSEDEKWEAVADDLGGRHERGQPVLVGTVSIEKSERLSKVLERRGVTHHVLNAKNHEKEAQIVAQAGRVGSVTVATNMAGRGVDILLGGNPEYLARQEMAANGFDNDAYLLFEMDEEDRAVYEAAYEPTLARYRGQTDGEHDDVVGLGGLYVLGTERHESRRIDNQLRGRSGRQGDPGESLFYLSLEDDLMRMFASDRVGAIMERLKWPEGEAIEAKMVTRAVENAQKQIEELNYERRKNVLKYDEVMNGQREVIYAERRKILEGQDLKEECQEFVARVVEEVVDAWCPSDVYPEEWDHEGLFAALGEVFPVEGSPEDLASVEDAQELKERFTAAAIAAYDRKEDAVTPAVMRELERVVLLNITDTKWREHLYEMDYLQEGIHLRAYAQRDPLTEYRREAFDMFELLTQSIREDFVKYIYRVELVRQDQQAAAPRLQRVQETKEDVASGAAGAGEAPADVAMGTRSGGAAPQAVSDKVPRNGPCPCGSGRKYKKCHGAAA